ncbi:hypothetical protein CYY_005380 [Polysphondylium violaceum]|uniref:FNIP repeat-containing protein n=1 Tax=Polysphondylium violaceum TaxID=133409 RepID=A0A8J4UZM7_9MYCE|nr:hypothetical protein CYY_005380 [Polysphondylium violaceum]
MDVITTTTKVMDKLFYSIWRNSYIRSKIRNSTLVNRYLRVSLQYLSDNHHILSALSYNDKLENDIAVILHIYNRETFIQYLNHTYRHLVNKLFFAPLVTQQTENNTLDFSCIPDSVDYLSFYVDRDTTILANVGTPSLTELRIYPVLHENFTCQGLDRMIEALPPSVKRLTLPEEYQIQEKGVTLPSTLSELVYWTDCQGLARIRSSNVNIFKHCHVNISSDQELQGFSKNLSTIGSLGIESEDTITLRPRMLPSHLIQQNVFPPSLRNLSLVEYDHPFDCGVLPEGLTSLSVLEAHNEFQIGSLPKSLKDLILTDYPHPFHRGVLPEGLEKLRMRHTDDTFKTIKHFYPSTLMDLEVQLVRTDVPLDHLTSLKIDVLDQHVAPILANIKKLYLSFNTIDPNTSLQDTLIEDLYLACLRRTPIPSKFLPRSLKRLTTRMISIQSNDTIPTGCVYLKTDIKHLNPTFIPSSVTSIENFDYLYVCKNKLT